MASKPKGPARLESQNRANTDSTPKRKAPRTAFQPGQSGNPGGRPKQNASLIELARAKTPEAIKVLVEVMTRPDSPAAARVSAATAILDRGHGKPVQSTELTAIVAGGQVVEGKQQCDYNVARRIAWILTRAAEDQTNATDEQRNGGKPPPMNIKSS